MAAAGGTGDGERGTEGPWGWRCPGPGAERSGPGRGGAGRGRRHFRARPPPAMAARLLLRAASAVRHGPARGYAKKPGEGPVKGKSVPKEELKGPEVCTDPVKLATYAVGVNYHKDSPDVALKPDSEYPDWLFQIHLGPPKKLEEMDPDSIEYWRRLRKYNTWQRNRLKKGKKL
uniref:Large ribosomal subunit protein mL54 n=1 Tax=Anas platyrhynchos TaxID=8839 RepID=A0A8B9ZCL3_ANAPL